MAFLFLFVGFFSLGWILLRPKIISVEKIERKNSHQQFLPEKDEKIISVLLVGNIMLNRGVKYKIEKYGGGDFRFPFLKIAEELKKADVVFGNLEGPISDKGVKVGSIYSFRSDPKSIEGLKFANFNILSLANNHVLDYGREAIKDTLLRLKEAGIDWVGAGFNENEAFSPLVKKLTEQKIGFLAFTNLVPESWRAGKENAGLAWISEKDFEKIKEEIKKAKENCDLLIISLHAGEEYQKSRQNFKENFQRWQSMLVADIVFGHHPMSFKKVKFIMVATFFIVWEILFLTKAFQKNDGGKMIKILIENKKIKKIIPIETQINEFFQPEIKKEAIR